MFYTPRLHCFQVESLISHFLQKVAVNDSCKWAEHFMTMFKFFACPNMIREPQYLEEAVYYHLCGSA